MLVIYISIYIDIIHYQINRAGQERLTVDWYNSLSLTFTVAPNLHNKDTSPFYTDNRMEKRCEWARKIWIPTKLQSTRKKETNKEKKRKKKDREKGTKENSDQEIKLITKRKLQTIHKIKLRKKASLRPEFNLHTKSILVASLNYGWTPDVTWTILAIFSLCFWTLIV